MHKELKAWGWIPDDGIIQVLKIDWHNNRPRPASHFVGGRFKSWEEAEEFAKQRGLAQMDIAWGISYIVWETTKEKMEWEREVSRRANLPLGWGEFYFSFTGTFLIPKKTDSLKKNREVRIAGVIGGGSGISRLMYATNHPKVGWLEVSGADWREEHFVYLPPDGLPQALRNGGSGY